MSQVLRAFWSTSGGPNLETSGGLFLHGNDTRLYKARFAGFLGDEKGLKEVFNSKGPHGMKPCLSCKNICQFLPVTPESYLQGIDAPPEKFDRATDDDIWDMAERLREVSVHGTRQQLDDIEKAYGLNYCERSVLFDAGLRNLCRPVSGWVRDWMQMLAIQGVANIEVEQMLGVLRENGVRPEMITEYFSNFQVPKGRGEIDAACFTPGRMGRPADDRDGWKGFANELLLIVPMMVSFLRIAVTPAADAALLRHARCFFLLDN